MTDLLKMDELTKTKRAGGRPTHEGWNLYHFEKVDGEKGKSIAKCLKCFNHLKNTTITRLLAHRKKCGSVVQLPVQQQQQPTIIRQAQPQQLTITHHPQQSPPSCLNKIEIEEYEEEIPRQEVLWTTHASYEEATATVQEQPPSTTMEIIDEDIRRHRQQSHKRRSDNFSSVDVALSSFLIGCNLTFSVVDSKHFKNFVAALNPDYKIPSSSQLTSKVLSQLKGTDGTSGSERVGGKKRKYYSSDSDYD